MQLMNTDNLEMEDESSHIMHLWSPFKLNLDEDYDFVPNHPLFKILSTLLYYFAYYVLIVFNKLFFNFKIDGKENIEKIKTGKITISNHVHPMDCTMTAIANFPNPVFFPTLKSNFGIPVVRHIIKLLNAIPIPDSISARQKFIEAIDTLLQNGKTVHFYPEGSLWPYYTKIRHFKDGAFRFAVQNNVPIIPMVYKFEENTGIWKYIKNKPSIKLVILEPIYPNTSLDKNIAIQTLKQEAYEKMKKEINK